MNTKIWIGLAAVWALTGCQANPYPKEGNISAVPKQQKPVANNPTIEVPREVFDVSEGETLQIPLTAHLAMEGAVPYFQFAGFPKGMNFDEATSTLSWTPSFDDANDKNDPLVVAKEHSVNVLLFDRAHPKIEHGEKKLFIRVHDKLRKFEFENFKNTKMTVYEGSLIKKVLQITSEDFPRGPFRVIPDGLPAGAVVGFDAQDPAVLIFEYTPNFQVVSRDPSKPRARNSVDFKMTFSIYDPRGHVISGSPVLTVYDSRQKPLIIAPKRVTQGLDVNIALSSEDINGEADPEMSLESSPKFGDWSLQVFPSVPVVKGQNPVTKAMLVGQNIPRSMNGKSDYVVIQSCEANRTACAKHPIQIDFRTIQYKAPIIDRGSWTPGKAMSVVENEKLELPVSVKDGDSADLEPTVKIAGLPKEATVEWEGGQLTFEATTPGHYRFQLTAISQNGMSSAESFWVEVLPAKWPKFLLLAEITRDPEIVKTKSITDDFQIVNPDIQPFDEPMMMGRTGLIVGTATLKSPFLTQPLEVIAPSLKKIFINSPLIANFQGSLLKELTSYQLTLGRRLTLDSSGSPSQAVGPELTIYEFKTTPKGKVLLEGTLTSESKFPQALILKSPEKCKKLMELQTADGAAYTVAAICRPDAKSERAVVVSGFEWGDIKTDPIDGAILKEWFKELVQ